MASPAYKQYAVLASSTVAFTVCFMIWMMFAVLGIPIKQQLGLSETQFGILAATPVLSGSLIREILAAAQRPEVISFAGGLPAAEHRHRRQA